MTETFTDEPRDGEPTNARWVALQELGTIARAVLLAAVALAIGWLVSSVVEGRASPEPARTTIGTR